MFFFLKLEIIFIYFYNKIYDKKNINYKINIYYIFYYNLNIYNNNKYIYLKNQFTKFIKKYIYIKLNLI